SPPRSGQRRAWARSSLSGEGNGIHGHEEHEAYVSHLDASALFRAHAAFVAAFLTRLGVARQELDDAVQDVFLVAHRRGGYTPGPAQPTTWLAEIAVRVVATLRRTRRRRPGDAPSSDAREASTDRTPFDALSATESLERVQRALDTLSLEHQ